MRDINILTTPTIESVDVAYSPWRVRPAVGPSSEGRQRSWIGRLLHRRETTTYQRCLAVHIHYAGPRSALS
jgi:hypothetical protein